MHKRRARRDAKDVRGQIVREQDLGGRADSDQELRDADRARGSNPPFTTTGKMSAPKFGSAGSGGAEIEPGPEKD